MLRELLTCMRSFDDVWWGTCEQAASPGACRGHEPVSACTPFMREFIEFLVEARRGT